MRVETETYQNAGFVSYNVEKRDFFFLSDSEELVWSPLSAALLFCTFLLREPGGAGGRAMIDLSHLTEEEQGAIMTVLRRDAELKKAEEDRIG